MPQSLPSNPPAQASRFNPLRPKTSRALFQTLGFDAVLALYFEEQARLAQEGLPTLRFDD